MYLGFISEPHIAQFKEVSNYDINDLMKDRWANVADLPERYHGYFKTKGCWGTAAGQPQSVAGTFFSAERNVFCLKESFSSSVD